MVQLWKNEAVQWRMTLCPGGKAGALEMGEQSRELLVHLGVREKLIFIAGGTQVTPELAVANGADAGFGRGSKGIHDATFMVKRRRELEAAGKWPK